MNTRASHTSTTALMLGGLALVAVACGSGSGGSTSAHLAAGSPSGSSAGASSAPGAIVSTASVDGATVLAAADGHTLYFTRTEAPGHIRCADACTGIWQPVMASRQQAQRAAPTLPHPLTVVARPGGGTQLAYAGHPLYVFTVEGPHQMRGDGAADEFDGTHFEWSAATADSSAGSGSSAPGGGNGGGGYGY